MKVRLEPTPKDNHSVTSAQNLPWHPAARFGTQAMLSPDIGPHAPLRKPTSPNGSQPWNP